MPEPPKSLQQAGEHDRLDRRRDHAGNTARGVEREAADQHRPPPVAVGKRTHYQRRDAVSRMKAVSVSLAQSGVASSSRAERGKRRDHDVDRDLHHQGEADEDRDDRKLAPPRSAPSPPRRVPC